MIGLALAQYRPYWAMAQSAKWAAEPVVLLILYGTAALLVTAVGTRCQATLLEAPLRIGVVTGALGVIHVLLENFIDFGERGNGVLALSFMATTFVLWGVAGHLAERKLQRGLLGGAAGGAFCGAVGGMIGVTCGLALELLVHPPGDAYVATWAEFKRSGWSDSHAFAMANAFESASQHLLLSPIIGAILGGVAGLVRRIIVPKALA
jgi:hypothetical protein